MSFVVNDSDPNKVLTRAPALEKIIKDCVNQKKNRSRKIENWSNPTIPQLFTGEGHNIMVLHKLFKNVLIRWDKDFVGLRLIHKWSNDPKTL